MRPVDFAGQLNISLANGWGIVRSVTDLCMRQPDGKYVLVKDPNRVRYYALLYYVELPAQYDFSPCTQPVIRLYAVPMTAFTNEEDEEGELEDTEDHDSAN